jgi:hypothetical protein
MTLVVGWRQPGGLLTPSNGGLVVVGMLEEAAEKVGASIHVQPCSAHCDYVFGHSDLYVHTDGDVNEIEFEPSDNDAFGVAVYVPEHDPRKIVDEIRGSFSYAVERFALSKNLGRRVIDLHAVVQSDLHSLLDLQYRRS